MIKKNISRIVVWIIAIIAIFTLSACSQAETVTHNLQRDADKFNIYRKMTFVNLYTNDLLYEVEGYFSIQTTYDNDYQGQQEIALIFLIGRDKFKMDYFSIAENVCYVIEQIEPTTTNPYYWNIKWYVALPNIITG